MLFQSSVRKVALRTGKVQIDPFLELFHVLVLILSSFEFPITLYFYKEQIMENKQCSEFSPVTSSAVMCVRVIKLIGIVSQKRINYILSRLFYIMNNFRIGSQDRLTGHCWAACCSWLVRVNNINFNDGSYLVFFLDQITKLFLNLSILLFFCRQCFHHWNNA